MPCLMPALNDLYIDSLTHLNQIAEFRINIQAYQHRFRQPWRQTFIQSKPDLALNDTARCGDDGSHQL